MKKIEMGKTYKTRNGSSVRVLCIDAPGDFPVVVLIAGTYLDRYTAGGVIKLEGKLGVDNCNHLNLIERDHWKDVAVDTKIWVRNCEGENWIPAHFCEGVDGEVLSYANGTSHTTTRVLCWKYAKLDCRAALKHGKS